MLIDKKTDNKSEQTHYFIKFDNPLSDDLITKLSDIGSPFDFQTRTCREFNKYIT